MRAFAPIALAVVLVGAVVLACGTDAVGVDTCRRIERVRCESAPACGIELGRPVHRGDSPESAVAACIRYYDDACLHGIAGAVDPDDKKVEACVDAIINGTCDVVRTPESADACKFLIPPAPPPPPPDAGLDAADDALADAATGG